MDPAVVKLRRELENVRISNGEQSQVVGGEEKM
jgi:hypothetical protein